jgi:hypothetical protein
MFAVRLLTVSAVLLGLLVPVASGAAATPASPAASPAASAAKAGEPPAKHPASKPRSCRSAGKPSAKRSRPAAARPAAKQRRGARHRRAAKRRRAAARRACLRARRPAARAPAAPSPGAVPAPPLATPSPAPPAAAAPGSCACLDARPAMPRPFSPGSFWNTPLPDSAALDADSDGLVATLAAQVTEQKAWINTYQYSSPLYVVGPDQPHVRVALDKPSSSLSAAFASVPLPPDVVPARGSDAQLVVWQPATDTMWEFFKLARRDDGWHANWGGRMTGMSSNPGWFVEKNWGATATGLPLLGGLITLDDLRRGEIDHALALGVTRARSGVWSWPARRTDGATDNPTAIPEGARFRLDPKLDLDGLALPPLTRMIAEAAQRYGIVVRDKTGSSVTFEAEDATRFATDPWYGPGGWFGGRSPSAVLASFPWSRLQALKLDMRSRSDP